MNPSYERPSRVADKKERDKAAKKDYTEISVRYGRAKRGQQYVRRATVHQGEPYE
jgi:hypothetical protein